jgi:hypothetical protein
MTDQSSPEPTEHDRKMAALRQSIADKQNAAYAEALALALGALGPGWVPWMRLDLIDSDHHRTGDNTPIATAYKVYRGEKRLTENSIFLRKMPDGSVMKADSYEALFGELLHEPHPSRELELTKGRRVPAPRWTLVWGSLELYHPKDAAQLAALRDSREAGKASREDARFSAENPLLAAAGIRRKDIEDDGTGRGR